MLFHTPPFELPGKPGWFGGLLLRAMEMADGLRIGRLRGPAPKAAFIGTPAVFRGSTHPWPKGHEKIQGWLHCSPSTAQAGIPMEAERINSIGNNLIDLSARTLDLRGYL